MRLFVHVEGQTEEAFVNAHLVTHLRSYGYDSVSARIVGNARLRGQRGGIKGWDVVRRDIINHLKQDRTCVSTMMVDYYALPKEGAKAWPMRAESERLAHENKALVIEAALLEEIRLLLDDGVGVYRFVPYIIMHEFEGLLFSDCRNFGESIGHPELVESFEKIKSSFPTPEHINDSPETAPSKRIAQLVDGYQKPLFGNIAICSIGLDAIRLACPNFNAWLTKLESLPKK